MRCRINSLTLADALGEAQRAVPSNPSLRTYSAVHLAAKTGRFSVTGSDGELTIRASGDCIADEPGECLFHPRPVVAWLQTVGNVEIEVEESGDGDMVLSAAGLAAYRFHTVSASFPRSPQIPGTPLRINLTGLKSALASLRTAVDRDSRIVQLVSSDTELRINATDTYRLCQVVIGGAGFGEFSGLISLSALENLSGEVDRVSVDVSGRVVAFASDDVNYTCRLAVVAFPAVDSILSNLPASRVQLPVGDVRRAIERLNTIVGESSLHCVMERDTLTLSVGDSSIGTGREVVAISNGPQAAFEFHVRPSYLSDALKERGSAEVTLAYSDALSPLFFVSSGNTYAVMPVRP